MKRLLLPCLALFSIVASAQAAPTTLRTVLPNGLTVIAVEDRSTPIAVFHLAVRNAAATVPADKCGEAALCVQMLQTRLQEHLGQDHFRALAEEVRGRGSLSFNTEMDYAEAQGAVTEPNLASALQLAGGLSLSAAPFTHQEVAAAKDLFSRALARGATNIVETTFYRFLRAMYGPTSYLSRPVTGTAQSIAGISADDLNAYRADYWGTNNTCLVVIGPRTPLDLTATARQVLGDLKPARLKALAAVIPPLSASHVSVAQSQKWRGASVMVGVPAPAFGTKDFVIAQIVYALLEGPKGRLDQDAVLHGNLGLNRLFGREQAQSTATILPPPAQSGSFLAVHLVTLPQLIELARRTILLQFAGLAKTPPTEAEMARARTRLINSQAQMQLKRQDVAKTINSYEIYHSDYTNAFRFAEQVKLLKSQDVVTFANKYCTNHAIGVVLPTGEDQ